MENVIKLPAQQSLFNANNNLVDIIIPGSMGVVDLSQSFVSILTRVTNEAGTAVPLMTGHTADVGVYDSRLHFLHNNGSKAVANKRIYDKTATPIECLVSSASMISASRGTVEDIRRADILRGTLSVYQKDLDSRQAEALTTWAGACKDTPFVHGNYIEMFGEGSLKSREATHEIRLPLKDLFDAGRFTEYDTSVYGDTRIHLELNLSNVIATQCCGTADPTWAANYQGRTGADAGEQAAAAEAFGYTSGPPATDISVPTVGGTPLNPPFPTSSILMNTPYDSIADSPWWVGQDVEITVTNTDATNAVVLLLPVAHPTGTPLAASATTTPVRAVITDITYDQSTGRVNLGFGANVVQAGVQVGAQSSTGLKINVKGADTAGTEADVVASTVGGAGSITYESVELTATMRNDVPMGTVKEHQYSRFVNQADVFSNTSEMQRTYQLPANCSAVLIAITAPDENRSNFLGSAVVTQYRFTIDGEQVTNRFVPFREKGDAVFKGVAGSSIHYDLLAKTFLNMGENARYQSMKECVYDQKIPVGTVGTEGTVQAGFADLDTNPQKLAYFIGTPVPMKDSPTQLLVELEGNFNAGGGGGQLQIYSYITSTI